MKMKSNDFNVSNDGTLKAKKSNINHYVYINNDILTIKYGSSKLILNKNDISLEVNDNDNK